jgi:dTDP-4-amino-4,6-dideoxygalactose transaminase
MEEKLALLGGEPVRTEPYPPWPFHDERDVAAVSEVVRSQQWGGYPYPGPRTAALIERFPEFQGGGYAVPMANGTVTLEVALRAAGIGWGDEVILPGYTFQATAVGVMNAGALPVIVDVLPDTYCIDPDKVESAITERTRAILPVHLGARMADMDAIMDVAGRRDLIVLEDCAHAHGARWQGRGAGTIGHFGSFSFQASKTVTTGEGGLLLCRTPELAERAASIMDCGRPHDAAREQFSMGINYRMTELQAALAMVALERFPEQMAVRVRAMEHLEANLAEIPGVRTLKRDPRHTGRAFYRYIFAIDPEVFGANRHVVTRALQAEGILAKGGYPPMHRYDLFQPAKSRLPVPSAFPEYFDFAAMDLPVSLQAGEEEAIWLDHPLFLAGEGAAEDTLRALRKLAAHPEQLSRAAVEMKT